MDARPGLSERVKHDDSKAVYVCSSVCREADAVNASQIHGSNV